MDAAVYDSVDNFIIGCRGNRLFVCNPTTGAIQAQLDVGPWASGRSSLAYDAGSNRIYFAPWNLPQYQLVVSSENSKRFVYRLHVAGGSLSLDQTIDVDTLAGFAVDNQSSKLEVGITAMDSGNGWIFCKWKSASFSGTGGGGSLRFSAANPASFTNALEGVLGGWNNIAYSSISGHDWAFQPDPEGGPEVVFYDYTSGLESVFRVANPRMILAVGADPNNHVYVTDINQLIYVYHPNGDRNTATLLNTIDTTRSAFNGLSVRYRSTDGFIYVAGGSDNSVAVINTAGSGSLVGGAVLTGFDAPVDFVFTPTTRFAVQAGSVPLKAF